VPKRDFVAITDDHRKKVNRDLRVYNAAKSEIRCTEKKIKQEKLNEEKEIDLEYKLIGKHLKAIELQKINEEKEKEEAEQERQRIERIRDEKLREKLRKESIELRELEAKLDVAYLNKARKGQIDENEAARRAADEAAEENRQFINQQTAYEVRAKQEKEVARIEGARRLAADLETQLIEKEKNKQHAYEQFLVEKKQIDDLVDIIKAEDIQRREDERERIRNHRTFIGNKEKYDQERKEEEERDAAEQQRKNREFEEDMERRAAQIKAERDDKAERLNQCQIYLRDKLHKKKQEHDDYENMIQALAMSEQEEKEKQKEQDLAEKMIRMRLELQKSHFQQLQQKQERLEAEQAEEDLMREKMMAKFACDDRIELMNAQKRRMKQLQHKKEVEQLLAERRARLAAEREQREAEAAKEKHDAEMMAQLIEEERQKMIEKHAKELLGYLPKGVIRNYDDLETLGDKYKEAYRPKTPDDN